MSKQELVCVTSTCIFSDQNDPLVCKIHRECGPAIGKSGSTPLNLIVSPTQLITLAKVEESAAHIRIYCPDYVHLIEPDEATPPHRAIIRRKTE